ncbi:11612_t:CDS:1, partial [Dentiscutata heterogama]
VTPSSTYPIHEGIKTRTEIPVMTILKQQLKDNKHRINDKTSNDKGAKMMQTNDENTNLKEHQNDANEQTRTPI